MKRFDFEQNGGFPLTQDRLKWMQDSYLEAIAALSGVGGLSRACVVSGVELTSGSWNGSGTVSDGWVFVPGEGLLPFVGGSFTAASNDVVVEDVFPNPPNPLQFEQPQTALNVQFERVMVISPGASNNLKQLSYRRWAAELGLVSRTNWVNCDLESRVLSGWVRVMADKLTGMVHVRGNVICENNSNSGVFNDGFPLLKVATLLSSTDMPLVPAQPIHFQCSLESPVMDAYGVRHITGTGVIESNGNAWTSGSGIGGVELDLKLVSFQPTQYAPFGLNSHHHFSFSYKV